MRSALFIGLIGVLALADAIEFSDFLSLLATGKDLHQSSSLKSESMQVDHHLLGSREMTIEDVERYQELLKTTVVDSNAVKETVRSGNYFVSDVQMALKEALQNVQIANEEEEDEELLANEAFVKSMLVAKILSAYYNTPNAIDWKDFDEEYLEQAAAALKKSCKDAMISDQVEEVFSDAGVWTLINQLMHGSKEARLQEFIGHLKRLNLQVEDDLMSSLHTNELSDNLIFMKMVSAFNAKMAGERKNLAWAPTDSDEFDLFVTLLGCGNYSNPANAQICVRDLFSSA